MAQKRVFVAGHNGLVGSAILRNLVARADVELIVRTKHELDLTSQAAVNAFMQQCRPDEIYLAAARVGGIHANNTYPVHFIHDNLQIECNVISAAHEANVQKLLFLGSSCIYPRETSQPVREEALLAGPLEPTNEPYAIAKIAGIKLCESYNRQYGRDYRSVMPTNLYGPGDNFHPENSHVIPAMMRRFHEAIRDGAQEVVIWGTGKPMREFLHVNDLASACIHVMDMPKSTLNAHVSPMRSHLNVGTGRDCTISELAETMAMVTGFRGALVFDTSKPDGTPRKLLDVTRIQATGWRSTIALEDGLKDTWQWFLANQAILRS